MYGGQAGSNGAVIVAAATVIRLLPVSPSTARNLLFLLPTRKKPLLRHPGDFTSPSHVGVCFLEMKPGIAGWTSVRLTSHVEEEIVCYH